MDSFDVMATVVADIYGCNGPPMECEVGFRFIFQGDLFEVYENNSFSCGCPHCHFYDNDEDDCVGWTDDKPTPNINCQYRQFFIRVTND